ncbi:efflux RND transporter periplasmic adaptor subunit [Psychrosphaera sp. 1_MG-2023]|uniref:efflux RND transporter periplasmic adaptor subunit n=1 Tax=Psychrosphaera sp. 1_MG-2023 TaxID=3062643 RepID=UPI0026E3EF05|nr:efflux RND transporter periplasmic adaptor subunit [Psychrosphaera sp. 1_MG-2023]MDO6720408.1 efflux RND transporter periplasmic adaptor subunit [Psychrosphaera sp. 1_MG-2023]
MSKTWLKIALPLVVLGVGIGLGQVVGQSGHKEKDKEKVDTRPIVSVRAVNSESHQVKIVGHGAVTPVEKTMLSAQVAGEILKWHPNFVAGGLVKSGEVLVEIDPVPYQAALLRAESSLSAANSKLVEEKGRADVAKIEAKTLPDAKVTDLYLRKPQLMSAMADVKSAQASVKAAQNDLNNTKVVAPYDALVINRTIGRGQYASPGMSIGEIYNIEKAEVSFPIAGFDRSFLPTQLAGKSAQISTEGNFSYTRQAVISRDSGRIDSDTRMSHLVVEINDPYSLKSDQPKVMFGSYVQVSFDGAPLNNVFRLSQDLVSNRKVWIIDEDNKLRVNKVEVVREEGEIYLIGSGLNENDKIVTTVPEYPQVGMEVRVAGTEAMEKDKKSDESQVVSPAAAQNVTNG